jgi:succinate dehydrogenase/fumarate reductase flavoprotein subunit
MPSEPQWDHTADVVVVGFGAAGATAAITAHDKGAHVLILEKQPFAGHLSTSHMSGGAFICPNDQALAFQYMEHLSKVDQVLSWTDKETLRTWAEYACQNKAWVESLGGKVTLRARGGEHDLPGSSCIEIYNFRGRGRGLMKFFKRQVEARGISVLYETEAETLLVDAGKQVAGVGAKGKGRPLRIEARQAVIMAPGGFEFNEEMKLNYLRVYPAYFAGSPANTGDGIQMVQAVGACLWHMNCYSAGLVLKFPDFPIALGADFGGVRGFQRWASRPDEGDVCGYIFVDRYGKRYTNENYKRHTLSYELSLYDSQKLEYPRIPSYWIFDRKRIEAGPLPLMFYGPLLYRIYRWSKNNQEEIGKGWIIRGETIEELARRLEMDPFVLKSTLQTYNENCHQKKDPEFNRPPQSLAPLLVPPFFGVKIWPGSANTQGGPRRNYRAQILDAKGKPIPRLYATGEFGSVYGMLYPATGGNIAECIAFGRIAGENSAREPHPSTLSLTRERVKE